MNLYRLKLTVSRTGRTPSHFTDWYDALTLDEAKALAAEDLHRYGIAANAIAVQEWTVMDRQTLKPLTN